MAEPFLGEIRIMSFVFPPKGWALCNGQTLQISQNQALFSLMGTTYGGDGRTTFAVPNLPARAPMHVGDSHVRGEAGGFNAVTLDNSAMPAHTHQLSASNGTGNTNVPVNDVFAASPSQLYDAGNLTTLSPSSVSLAGGGVAHQNMQPYLVLSFCVALVGIFPRRN